MRKTIALLLACLTAAALLAQPQPAYASAADFFKDAVFLGDSLTVGLDSYVAGKRKSDKRYFSNARFLARVSYAVSHTLQEDGYSMHPEYEGELLQPQKSLEAMDAKKVFITLGVNDVGAQESTIVSNYKKLIAAIRDALPKAELYMLAVFPMTARKETTKRCNAVIDALNKKLLALAMDSGATFIDITPALKAEDNTLDASLSSDDYVHLNSDGYAVWAKQLYAFAEFMQSTGSVASGAKANIINVSSFVNARSGPGTEYDKVTTIKKGESVTITENAGGSWYKVEYGGKTLYVHGKYLSAVSGGLPGAVCNVNEYANLRKGPSADAAKAGKAPKGATLAISKRYYSPKWYRAEYEGSTVYISSSYVKIG